MAEKKRPGFGKRGWILMLYMFLAFVVWCTTQNSLNILSPLYAATRGWNATLITSVYTIGSLISIVVHFLLNNYVANHSVKKAAVIFGILSVALAVFLSLAMQQALFCIIYVCMKICQDMWALIANGVMAGQWFPAQGYCHGHSDLRLPSFLRPWNGHYWHSGQQKHVCILPSLSDTWRYCNYTGRGLSFRLS
jgi:MFS family permease